MDLIKCLMERSPISEILSRRDTTDVLTSPIQTLGFCPAVENMGDVRSIGGAAQTSFAAS